MTQANIGPGRFFIGARQPQRVLVTDDGTADGSPTDMSGWEYAVVIRRDRNDAVDLVSITDQGAFTQESVNGTNDRVSWFWERVMTLGVLEHHREYQWALWRTDGEEDFPIAWGSLIPEGVAIQ